MQSFSRVIFWAPCFNFFLFPFLYLSLLACGASVFVGDFGWVASGGFSFLLSIGRVERIPSVVTVMGSHSSP